MKPTFRPPRKSKQERPRSTRPESAAAATSSSWQPVNQWYNEIVGEKGHYYHQHVIIPQSLKMLKVSDDSKVLDLACGQGVLARHLPEHAYYFGVDASRSLIEAAKDRDDATHHHYLVADLSRTTFPQVPLNFTHATMILALQNIADPVRVCTHAAEHLSAGGKFLIVLNHPCFRIPRQSSWGVDDYKKIQYRRIDRYLSPIEIPIQAHPGKSQHSALTWSYHFPLSTYINALAKAGFAVTQMEEWNSDKISQGKAAKMENRGRTEIPLFMAILAEKR